MGWETSAEKNVRRGYAPSDAHDFSGPPLTILRRAAEETRYLLNRGYAVKSAVVFVGNHHQLSERQRLALVRAAASDDAAASRGRRELQDGDIRGRTVHIDAFNTVITLEVALSGSPILRCMDGAIRDLAGLRGTYRIISRTREAVRLIFAELGALGADRSVWLIDAPVSNSGRLGALVAEAARTAAARAEVRVIPDVDRTLRALPGAVTSDSAILDACAGWFNLNRRIVGKIPGRWQIDMSGPACG